jgi:hypothetical protein
VTILTGLAGIKMFAPLGCGVAARDYFVFHGALLKMQGLIVPKSLQQGNNF